MKHTQEPWHVGKSFTSEPCIRAKEADNQAVAVCCELGEYEDGTTEAEANAERIVTCVNSHDELLEACKAAKKLLGCYRRIETQFEEETINELEEAIAKAEATL